MIFNVGMLAVFALVIPDDMYVPITHKRHADGDRSRFHPPTVANQQTDRPSLGASSDSLMSTLVRYARMGSRALTRRPRLRGTEEPATD